jgi:hypothetical protein
MDKLVGRTSFLRGTDAPNSEGPALDASSAASRQYDPKGSGFVVCGPGAVPLGSQGWILAPEGPIRRRHVLTLDKIHRRAPLAGEVDARLRQGSGAARPPSTPKGQAEDVTS